MKWKRKSFQSRRKKQKELYIDMKLMEGELRALLEMLERQTKKVA